MTNLHTLNRRLDRLDSARSIADRRVICMVQEEGETQADAIARNIRPICARYGVGP